MAGPMYVIQPDIIDAPPEDNNPAAWAWFTQFSSGHLRHTDQALAAWSAENGIPSRKQKMNYGEYLRLMKESHWYE